MGAGPSAADVTLLEANAHPAEAIRLAAERRTDLLALGFLPASAGPDPWTAEVRGGTFPGVIWLGPGEEAVGIARWEAIPRAGRRAELHLASGFRNAGAVGRFVHELEGTEGPAPFRYALPTAGAPAAELAGVFEPLGFRHLVRYQMTFELHRSIPDPPSVPALRTRPVRPEDEPALVGLASRAYADWPMDPAYHSPGLSVEEDARQGFRDLFGGAFGPLIPGASTAVESDGALVGATMVNDRNGPLITEVLTDPAWRRRGVATTALLVTLRALRSAGAPTPRLNVTAVNVRARALYERLGFRITPFAEDNMWVSFERLGQPDLARLLPPLDPARASPQRQ